MKKIILLLILTLVFGCNTEELPVITPEIGPGYYRAVNYDVDGKHTTSPIAFTGVVTNKTNTNGRVSGDVILTQPPYTLDEFTIDGCFRVSTYVCYDSDDPNAISADTRGAKFGIKFEFIEGCVNYKIKINTNALSSSNYPDPFTDIPYYQNKYWTSGTIIEDWDLETSHLQEPTTSIVWIPQIYDPSTPNYNWDFWIEILDENNVPVVIKNPKETMIKLATKANFNQSPIDNNVTCSEFALPVTWVGVSAKQLDKCNLFTFTITEEEDVDYYEIEFSKDAKVWEVVGSIPAGNPGFGEVFTYEFEHCNE